MAKTKSSSKRNAILIAAKKLFFEKGFSGVSMENINIQAGVSKNTLYSHFKNKEDLFQQVVYEHWHQSTSPRIDPSDHRATEPLLKEYMEQVIHYLYQKDTMNLFRILIAESARFPNLTQAILEHDTPPMLLSLTKFIESRYNVSRIQARQYASCLFGLLKEDAFWHVLISFAKPYSPAKIRKHINNCLNLFNKLISH